MSNSNIYETCKSCGTHITANYCPNCGQKKYHRIDGHYIVDEVQSIMVQTKKGLLYTLKKLLINPGNMTRQYIDGDRAKHYKPILLAFLLATISAFISVQFLEIDATMDKLYETIPEQNNGKEFSQFFLNYNNFIMVLIIPVFALCSWLAFKAWKHNFYEHVVMNAYFQCYYSLFTIVVAYPIYFFTKSNIQLYMFVSVGILAFVPLLYLWFIKGFYPEKKLGTIILRVLLSYFLVFVIFVIVLFSIGFLVAFFSN